MNRIIFILILCLMTISMVLSLSAVPLDSCGIWIIHVDIINAWGKDYEMLFDVPEGKIRPVFYGMVANAQMTNNLFKLEKKIKSLKYALMYGRGVINQINAYMDIVYRLYSSLPFEYREVYGNKIKRYSF